jgi:hypothetical protein
MLRLRTAHKANTQRRRDPLSRSFRTIDHGSVLRATDVPFFLMLDGHKKTGLKNFCRGTTRHGVCALRVCRCYTTTRDDIISSSRAVAAV